MSEIIHEKTKYLPRYSSDLEVNQYLESMKEKHLARSWKMLDMNFKWNYISDYLNIQNVNDENMINIVKEMLTSNRLKNVVYDNKKRIITSLGIKLGTKNGSEILL